MLLGMHDSNKYPKHQRRRRSYCSANNDKSGSYLEYPSAEIGATSAGYNKS